MHHIRHIRFCIFLFILVSSIQPMSFSQAHRGVRSIINRIRGRASPRPTYSRRDREACPSASGGLLAKRGGRRRKANPAPPPPRPMPRNASDLTEADAANLPVVYNDALDFTFANECPRTPARTSPARPHNPCVPPGPPSASVTTRPGQGEMVVLHANSPAIITTFVEFQTILKLYNQ